MEFMEEIYLNEFRASEILSIPVQTLRNWRVRGKGPAYCKPGTMIRYKLQDLIAFMEAGRINPQASGKDSPKEKS